MSAVGPLGEPATVRRALHLGNRIGSEGGIASVLAVLAQAVVPGWSLSFVATYDQRVSARGLRLLPRAAAVVLFARVAVVHVHLSERGSFLREGMLAALARSRGRRVVLTLHGAELADFARARPRLVRWVLRQAHVVLALSQANAEQARQLLPGAEVRVLPNPVVVPASAPALPAAPVVLFAGEQGRRKGLDVLLEAWPAVRSRVPAAELIVAGVAADVAVPALPGLRDVGMRSRAQVHDLIMTSRVCVLPSRFEVLPMFLLEAMSLGRAVVVTPVGGVPELVGDAGVIVPVGDAPELAEALAALLSDTPRNERLGVAAHETVSRTNSAERVGQDLAEVYDTVTAGAAGGAR